MRFDGRYVIEVLECFMMSSTDPFGDTTKLRCAEVRDLLYLYVCEELSADEAIEIRQHLDVCADCNIALTEHKVLNQVLPGGFSKRTLYYYSTQN